MRNKFQYTLYACFIGYITQAIVNNLAPLLFIIFQSQLGFSLSQITSLVTINFLVQLLVDALCAGLADRLGYRLCVVSSHLFCAAGLIGLSSLFRISPQPYWGMLVSVVLYAIGGGMIEVLISPIVEACPTDHKASAMSLLHSFYCWGTVAVILLSSAFLAIFAKTSWPWLAAIWSLVPLLNAWFFTQVPIPHLTSSQEKMPLAELLKLKRFWVLMGMMICAGASEQAMSQWSSAFAEKGLGLSKFWGDLFGPCLFATLMGTARLLLAKNGQRVRLIPLLSWSACLCLGAYILASLSGQPIVALLGCGLCGFAVGVLWPGTFSVAAADYPRGGTALFAFLALGGDVGCSLGPTLVGLISDRANGQLQAGLLAALMFPLLLLILLGVYSHMMSQKTKKIDS